jgi:hypothetical protein
LVIDHAVPIAKGGDNSEENLVTACEACNQGKGARSLGERAARPDADLMYLQAKQEEAELARFVKARTDLQKIQNKFAKGLQTTWCERTGFDWHPSTAVLIQALGRNTPDDIEQALNVTASKISANSLGTRSDDWLRYFRGVLRSMRAERGEE